MVQDPLDDIGADALTMIGLIDDDVPYRRAVDIVR